MGGLEKHLNNIIRNKAISNLELCSWPHEEYAPEQYGDSVSHKKPHGKPHAEIAASTHHDHHENHREEEPTPITYNTAAWHKTLGVLAFSLLAWRVSQEYTTPSADGEGSDHPISDILARLQSYNTAEDAIAIDKASIPIRQQTAHDSLILSTKEKRSVANPPRWTIPLDRASSFLVPVGSHVEGLGEGRIYSWQENDQVDSMGKS